MREVLIGLEMDGRIPHLLTASKAAFPASAADLDRIGDYLDLVTRDSGDFFEYLQLSLSR